MTSEFVDSLVDGDGISSDELVSIGVAGLSGLIFDGIHASTSTGTKGKVPVGSTTGKGVGTQAVKKTAGKTATRQIAKNTATKATKKTILKGILNTAVEETEDNIIQSIIQKNVEDIINIGFKNRRGLLMKS